MTLLLWGFRVTSGGPNMATVENITQVFLEAFRSLSPQAKQDLLNQLCQLPEKTRARIPGEISLAHYADVNRLLLDLLDELNAMQVVARLNETAKEEPAPVFIGWVENTLRQRTRLEKNDPHPALLRAGDTDSSTTYERCYREGIVERDWMKPEHVQERRSNELCLSQKTGVNYLRVIRIEVREDGQPRRGVGVLGAGFRQKPDDLAKIDDILRTWAQSDSRELVPYLTKSFALGGRLL
jgi:hypothetical protein